MNLLNVFSPKKQDVFAALAGIVSRSSLNLTVNIKTNIRIYVNIHQVSKKSPFGFIFFLLILLWVIESTFFL